MSFLPSQTSREVPADGDPNSLIAIVGEAPGAFEVNSGKPFVGPAGRVLEQCLHGAGLIRGELYITNLIKYKIKSIDTYYNERRKALTDLGQKHAELLWDELADVKANIIVPLGNPALAALTGQGGIMRRRGYIAESPYLRRKILPTIHPAAAIRGNYLYRHYITADLRKAKANSDTSEIVWPEVEIHIPKNYWDAVHWLKWLKQQPALSIDIEVMNFEVSCIGFCWEDNKAVVIPMYGAALWTEEEEVGLWSLIAAILEDPEIAKTGQNFIFDMQFLAQRNNIITRGHIDDTMIKASIQYPDFPKSLEFLVSVHCNRPYWKDMVQWKGADLVKKES